MEMLCCSKGSISYCPNPKDTPSTSKVWHGHNSVYVGCLRRRCKAPDDLANHLNIKAPDRQENQPPGPKARGSSGPSGILLARHNAGTLGVQDFQHLRGDA